jgi:hypothetical protein
MLSAVKHSVQDQKAGLQREAKQQDVNGTVNIMKKLSPKQKKIASKAKPYNKITGADFKKLKKKK